MTTAPQVDPRETEVASREEAAVFVPPPRRSWAWLGIAGWVAAAALGVTIGTFWETIVRLRHEVQIREERTAEMSGRLGRDQRWIAFLSAPGLRKLELLPTSPPSERSWRVRGNALYDPGSQRALVVFQEAVAPRGRDYQLWAYRAGSALNLGVLRPDSMGIATFRLENMGGPGETTGFMVSLEPKGGIPNDDAPIGPSVLQGSFPN